MKIFQIHNKYRFFGGEDSVVDDEAHLLKANNHKVIQLIKDNAKELSSLNEKFYAFRNISYSKKNLKLLDLEIQKPGEVQRL